MLYKLQIFSLVFIVTHVHFLWTFFVGKCLYLSGLIPEPMNACDDYRLKEIGIGFTNFVSRCSKGSVELTRFVLSSFLGQFYFITPSRTGGSMAEWLVCWTQAQKGLGSNRSRDAVGQQS